MREYVVSPLLLYTGATASHSRRYRDLNPNPNQNQNHRNNLDDVGDTMILSEKQMGKLPEGPEERYRDIRTNRLLDSALAGVLAGGSLSWGSRGSFLILLLLLPVPVPVPLFQLQQLILRPTFTSHGRR